ncbi:MAG TPA: DNA polymerase III subunit delta [Polyangiaceae bacterium]|nr:DNA polymerase III subunit delta [Polyangiaceae bacterium]
MSPEQAVAEARDGKLRPVYLLHGAERYLSGIVLAELRKAVIGGVDLGLNEDHFDASEVDGDSVVAAARTLPMMAKLRLVVARSIERWEPKGEARPEGETKAKGKGASLDRIADYAANPSPSTTLVLVAEKLDARRKLFLVAKKEGFLVECEALPRGQLPGWLTRRARERQKDLAPGVAELLSEIAGPELARLDDAVERLSLYVGADKTITEDAVAEVVVGVKPSSVWELVSAVGRKDVARALATLARVYDPKDRGLPLLGTLAWSTRQLLKFSAAIARGASREDAARHAGAPPFKAQELADQARRFSAEELERWVTTLADVDLALKGGSKRPPQAILEAMIVTLCGGEGGRAGASRGPAPGRTGPHGAGAGRPAP